MSSKKRILFVAEAVTLAHAGRMLTLARSLDPARYEVWLAVDPRYQDLVGTPPFPVCPIRTIPAEQFLRALAKGSPIYSAATLGAYVEQDLKLMKEIAPDVVVGDFRISLNISARVAGIPYCCLTNAYWSPTARTPYPVPEIPLARFAGAGLAQQLFNLLRPLVFAIHALPLNAVRRRYGLPGLGPDLRRCYTDADCTLYADIPQLFPCDPLPENHHYIGPVLWEPDLPLPDWWDRIPSGRPVIYVTLGSSGASEILPRILQALGGMPVTVIAATAGRIRLGEMPRNVLVADYVPGSKAAARAQLVICNGGSPTAYQALAAGTPVLGIPSNLDQYLNMWGVAQAGAGTTLRAGHASVARIRSATEDLLADARSRNSAVQLADVIARHASHLRFEQHLAVLHGVAAP